MSPCQKLSVAGFCATAIAFGPARMGFGLFVPELRADFSLSISAIGSISSLGFLGFFIALCMSQPLLLRGGARLPILTGLTAATVGMTLIATAPNIVVLALGVFVAAASAGLAWTPFNNAAQQIIAGAERPRALSVISSGTAIGIFAAGGAAVLTVFDCLSWRVIWAAFATAAALVLACNCWAFRAVDPAPLSHKQTGWAQVWCKAFVPLAAVGFAYGTTSAVFIAFAADHAVEQGGLPGLPTALTPAIIFVCYGLMGLSGLLTSRAKYMIGLPALTRFLMIAGAVSLVLMASFPTSWGFLTAAAGLQGVHVMMTSALLSFWSARLFPAIPSLSFTAVLLMAAAGSVLGPALGGVIADGLGMGSVFLVSAGLPALVAVLFRDHHGRELQSG